MGIKPNVELFASECLQPYYDELDLIRRKIVSASEPDNPTLLIRFLELGKAAAGVNKSSLREVLVEQVDVLISTAENACLPSRWRELCLNNIHKPLGSLGAMVDDPKSVMALHSIYARLRGLRIY